MRNDKSSFKRKGDQYTGGLPLELFFPSVHVEMHTVGLCFCFCFRLC